MEEEAEERGLSLCNDVLDLLKNIVSPEAKELFSEMNVFSDHELDARLEIYIEKYNKKMQIESRVIGDLAVNHILPVVYKYQNVLIENVNGLKKLFNNSDSERLNNTSDEEY
jgi:glutamine synthetase